LTTVLLYDHRMRDGQSLPCPFANFFGGKERVENFVPNGRGDTRPGVGDANLYLISYLACTDDNGAFLRRIAADATQGMGGIDQNGENYLIELAWHTGHEREVRVEISHHLRYILPLIAHHRDGALDGLVEIDTHLFLGARMGKLFHGEHDSGDTFDALKGLLDSRGDLLGEIGNIDGRSSCFYLAQDRGCRGALCAHLIRGRIGFQ